jgi:hypothetical protein
VVDRWLSRLSRTPGRGGAGHPEGGSGDRSVQRGQEGRHARMLGRAALRPGISASPTRYGQREAGLHLTHAIPGVDTDFVEQEQCGARRDAARRPQVMPPGARRMGGCVPAAYSLWVSERQRAGLRQENLTSTGTYHFAEFAEVGALWIAEEGAGEE